MRRLVLLSSIFCVLAISCAKEENPLVEENPVEYVNQDAAVVESIMTKSFASLNSASESQVQIMEYVDYFLTDLLPKYGISSIMAPLYEQVKECYVNDTLRVGLNNLSGQFTAALNKWRYSKSDHLQFIFPGKDGEKVDYSIVCGNQLTESPIYHQDNIFITLPSEIQTITDVDGEHFGRSQIKSSYRNEEGEAIGEFTVQGNLLDSLSSEGKLEFDIIEGNVDYLDFCYTVVDNEGNKPVIIEYEYGMTGADFITITMGGRLRFEIDIEDFYPMVTTILMGNASLEKDKSAENVEKYRRVVSEFNEESDIHFYLDGVLMGDVTLEVLEDNEEYAVDMVMAYSKDGSRYEIHEIYSGISALIERASSVIDIIEDLIDYIASNSKQVK